MSVNTTNTPRGEQAKLALLEAAIEIFGLNGPNSATTRQIAQRADQNIAAIAYYFGSKTGCIWPLHSILPTLSVMNSVLSLKKLICFWKTALTNGMKAAVCN